LRLDFPDKWSGVVEEILKMISTQDPARIRSALFILRIVTKLFEYALSATQKKTTLNYIVDGTFPVLEKLFEYLATQNSPLAIEMEILILKIFWSSFQFAIPTYLLIPDKFNIWVQLFIHILNRPVPLEFEPKIQEEKRNWGPWKVKLWTVRIFERCVSRYAVPKKIENDINKSFCNLFMNQYIGKLLEISLNYLSGPLAPHSPPKILTALINYVNACIYYSKTWILVKPHIDIMVKSLFFPMLCSIEDISVYENDPQEYIRLEFDIQQDFIDPRNAIITFLTDVIKLRGQDYLTIVMNHCLQILNRYAQSQPHEKNPVEKHAALVILGSLSPLLINSPAYKDGLEELITVHIFSEFRNDNVSLLRARAISVFGKFYNLKYQFMANFFKGIEYLIASLKDKSLPVSVFSAVALQGFIKSKAARPAIEQVTSQLLEAFLNLMNHVDNDDLVGALDLLITKYADKIREYIPQVAARVVQNYARIISRGDELFEEDDSASLLTAMELLRTILTILENTKSVQGMYSQLEPLLVPVIMNVSISLVDMFSDYIQILTYFTFHGDISDALWAVFDQYVEIYFSWGRDFLQELLKPFDNFISRSTDKFLSRGSLEKIWNIYKNALESEHSGESDAAIGCDLIEVVFVYCRGKVDSLVGPAIDAALTKLNDAEMPFLKVALLQVVANTFYYNPIIALNHLESKGVTLQLFQTWFSLFNTGFKRRHEIKVTILGFSALLYVPFSQWPQVLQSQLKNLITTLMELCKRYMKIKEEESNSSGETSSDLDDSERDSEDDGELDIDDMPTEKSKVEMAELKQNIKELKHKVYPDNEDVAPDMLNGAIFSKIMELYDGAPSDEEIEDDYEFSTLIDDVDEVVFFLEAFQSIQKREGHIYQQILSTFSSEEQTKLQELANEANQRQKDKVQKSQNKS